MEIKRTANAGVLLRLDGKSILLDGVCGKVEPYLATPPEIRGSLLQDLPDAIAFTHTHEDHYDSLFVSDYLQNAAGPVMGPADIPYSTQEQQTIGAVTVSPFDSRHVGKTDCAEHRSYVIRGSRCLWFMGDASLLHWQKTEGLPRPDVIIAPYGFVIGRGWEYCKALRPQAIVVLHLPAREHDPYGLWQELEKTLAEQTGLSVLIPEMGHTIVLL